MEYVCVVCKRELESNVEEVHIAPRTDPPAAGGYDVYCTHCWFELKRWLGQYGIDMEKDEEQ